jgi:hypothetical protein
MSPTQDQTTARVFYSYSHTDERLRDSLANSLALLKRQGVLTEWHDRRIAAGDDWGQSIDQQIEQADIIMLLVSPDFIASDYCWGKEVRRAMERHQAGEARVIPVILRPVDWRGAMFGKLQALPKNAKPITLWSNRDLAWLDVAKGIRAQVEGLAEGRPAKTPQPAAYPALQPALPDVPPTSKREAKSWPELSRAVYDARGGLELPGTLARKEGASPKGDPAVDEVYAALGITYQFFREAFDRNSIDDAGAPLIASVHYGNSYNNAFWSGKQMVFGDGDGRIFKPLISVDSVAKQFGNGVVSSASRLIYWGQSGALHNSMSLVFAMLVKQFEARQTASQADWLFGDRVMAKGGAIYSFAAPGTAYDDSALGKDPQPRRMRDFVETQDDNGGIHVNAGIPNRAFYLTAVALGGFAWEKAGHIWYEALRDKTLKPDAGFADFALVTQSVASRRYGQGSEELLAVRNAWDLVGVGQPSQRVAAKTRSPKKRPPQKARAPRKASSRR